MLPSKRIRIQRVELFSEKSASTTISYSLILGMLLLRNPPDTLLMSKVVKTSRNLGKKICDLFIKSQKISENQGEHLKRVISSGVRYVFHARARNPNEILFASLRVGQATAVGKLPGRIWKLAARVLPGPQPLNIRFKYWTINLSMVTWTYSSA